MTMDSRYRHITLNAFKVRPITINKPAKSPTANLRYGLIERWCGEAAVERHLPGLTPVSSSAVSNQDALGLAAESMLSPRAPADHNTSIIARAKRQARFNTPNMEQPCAHLWLPSMEALTRFNIFGGFSQTKGIISSTHLYTFSCYHANVMQPVGRHHATNSTLYELL